MTLRNLRKVNNLLLEFVDFFDANSDGDETNLNYEMAEKYKMVSKIISDEFYRIHLKNEISKINRKRKSSK